jgi:hypothetical protein
VRDIVQKKHAVLRNYPIIGHLRYFLENQVSFFCIFHCRRTR